jgi:DNA-binding IclR family transcriptional regulator
MSVKSAIRALEILEVLADHDQGLSVKEMSEALNIPQSSTFNLVQTLYTDGYLVQSYNKRYKLGPKLIRIGSRALASFDLHRDARVYLQDLMEKVEETVFMAVLSDLELIYIAKVDSNRSIKTSAEIGSRKPLYCTGLGKAFLSFLPKEKQEECFEKTNWVALTPKTIVSPEEMRKQLTHFNTLGYAIDDEESEEGLYCYSAPIFGPTGEIVAAISTAGPKERITRNSEKVTAELLNTSRRISENLGYFNR